MLKIFQTKSGRIYAYVPFTNQIVTIKTDQPISLTPKTVKSVERQLLADGLVEDKEFSFIRWKCSFDEYIAKMRNQIPKLLLEITRRCNLFCDYCSVSGALSSDEVNPYDMTADTLFSAIDLFREHNLHHESAHISFYGGEALLRFPLIQAGVQYARETLLGKELSFDISTNGVALTENVVTWLAANPFVRITCTVNGPYHDQYRKDIGGKGSLNTTMGHLKYIRDNYPQVWQHQVRFIANVDREEEIPILLEFYRREIGKAPGLVTKITWENDLSLEDAEHSETDDRIPQMNFSENDYLSKFYAKQLWSVHYRPIVSGSQQAVITSCFPCEVKLFVHTDGRLGFCEMVCEKAIIGDLKTGIDEAYLRELYVTTQRVYRSHCLGCWAQRLCNVCLANLFEQDGTLIKKIPVEFCLKEKKRILKDLTLYCQMAEEAPELLHTI